MGIYALIKHCAHCALGDGKRCPHLGHLGVFIAS